MAEPVLNILYIDTYTPFALGLADFSTYPTNYNIVSPSIQITLPTGEYNTLPFVANSVNIFNSASLGLTCAGEDYAPLPDGIYRFKYTINPSTKFFVEKTILRTDCFQERFDSAFLKLDLDCNSEVQDKRTLTDIWFFIQEAIASANKCAIDLAVKMYKQADKMLKRFTDDKCC